MRTLIILSALILITACSTKKEKSEISTSEGPEITKIKPVIITDTVNYDSDDPAIWINYSNPSKSLIIGTDKGGEAGDGALFVFGLDGKEIKEKTVHGIKRPNNVDIAYGIRLGNQKVDIAVCTERNTNSIRVFTLPDMKAIDNGGLPVFENDTARAPMGIALYKDKNGNVYAIVSRKTGPSGSYLWQYDLKASQNNIVAKCVRKFGTYSGKHEIEAIAVDNESGYVYYSDEGAGIRKYYAHPDSSNTELALFGTDGFTDNHEGISIYKKDSTTGYIIVSDQQANKFYLFTRQGSGDNKHKHELLKVVEASTIESDGNEVTSYSLPGFPQGLFVAMSDDKTFQFYNWEDIVKDNSTAISIKPE